MLTFSPSYLPYDTNHMAAIAPTHLLRGESTERLVEVLIDGVDSVRRLVQDAVALGTHLALLLLALPLLPLTLQALLFLLLPLLLLALPIAPLSLLALATFPENINLTCLIRSGVRGKEIC